MMYVAGLHLLYMIHG